MILRFNKSNRIRAYGLPYDAIDQIEIQKLHFFTKNIFTQKRKKKTKGLLHIKENFNDIILKIPVNQVEKIIAFFNKLPICNKIVIVEQAAK